MKPEPSPRNVASIPVWLAAGSGALALACLLGLAFAVLPLLPFQYQWARQRWEQNRPRHYELEATWRRDQQSGHARIEVRDDQFVAGVDLDTGRALRPAELRDLSRIVSIESMFRVIDARVRPSPNWRHQLGRYHPLLARWLAPCAAPIPQVRYDAALGYPTSISYRGGACIATLVSGENVDVRIERLRPLP
jgi:hypothetical protein